MLHINKTDKFKEKVHNLVGSEYIVIGEYINNKTKITMKHTSCGSTYSVQPKGFLDGNRCPSCNNKTKGAKVKSHSVFLKDVERVWGVDIKIVSSYRGVVKPIYVSCNTCGNTWKTTPNKVLSKTTNCMRCSRVDIGLRNRTSHEEFEWEIHRLYGEEYTLLEPYTLSTAHIKVRHNTCGHIWDIRASHLKNKAICPKCTETAGERRVRAYLDSKNVEYETQKKFSELTRDKPLSYDFWLLKHNVLIEFQGIQHYKPIDFFGGYTRFTKQKESDSMKRTFAYANGYTLIEVPYYINDVKKYLDDVLKL